MPVSVTDIQTLRERTGVGMMDAKKALEAHNGDIEAAITELRKSGQKVADAKQSRQTREGVIGTYVHSNNKVVGIIALACETDFVARTEAFQELAHELAMHVAAMSPRYVSSDDIPADVLAQEEEIAKSQAAGKPEAVVANIVAGKLRKFAEDHCLLDQTYFKDDSQRVRDVIGAAVQRLGENIQVRSIARHAL